MTRLKLRYLTSEDIPFADSLRGGEGWNQTVRDWQRFIDLSPRGCLVAECEGRPVATVTTTPYGKDLAWIGMMLVHPDYRRRGIARVLMEHCIEILRIAGIKSIKLDATPAGREVYLRLGFKDEFTITRYTKPAGHAAINDDVQIRPFKRDDLSKIVQLDESAIGARRDDLIERLITESTRALVCESAAKEITGFGLLRPGSQASYLGPIISKDCGERLATALIGTDGAILCDLPDQDESATAWAKAQGFTAQRTLTRMFLGEKSAAPAPQTYFAIAAPDLG